MARQNWRNFTPLFVGFVLGSLLSIFLIPTAKMIDQECTDENFPKSTTTAKNNNNLDDDRQLESRRLPKSNVEIDDASKLTTTTTKSPTIKSNPSTAKITRPRFFATELGVKDKLFVGVVTSRSNLPTVAAAINKTVAHHVSKLMFFVDSDSSSSLPSVSTNSPPKYLNLVNIAANTPENLKPFAILNYMAGRGRTLANNYDWFFFMPDSTYLKAFKLFELVSHMSFGYEAQMGRAAAAMAMAKGVDEKYCDFNAGILISYGLMRSILANLRQCMKRVDPEATASENFGRCVLFADEKATCSEEWNGKIYRSWPLVDPDQRISDILPDLAKHDSFNSALTVFPISSAADIFHLHKYYCDQEIDQINQLITTMEQNLLASSIANYNSNDNSSEPISWPPGLPPASKQRSRYELLKWDYFTDREIFENNNDQNVRSLSGVHRKDVDDVIKRAAKTMESKYPRLKFRRLANGYRRFDPRRGMEYMLDLRFDSSENGGESIDRRVHLLRPLNRVELITVPYVTEASPVVILLPVSPGDEIVAAARSFLDRFSKFCLDADENARLILVLFYDNLAEQESYKALIDEIEDLRRKYGYGDSKTSSSTSTNRPGGLEYVHIRSSVPSPFLSMDLMLQTVGRDHLYLLATPWTEVYGDFLNRVRMNTIKEYQVYFPIPFAQFDPKIVYRRSKIGGIGSAPEHIDVHKDVGRFDRYDYGAASFYGSDYEMRRSSAAFSSVTSDRLYFEHDLISLFFNSTLHVFRAIEPALKIRYHDQQCDGRVRGDLVEKCSMSKKQGLGTKAQLAGLLYELGAIDDGI